MPTIEQHLTAIYTRLDTLDGAVEVLRAWVLSLEQDPLQHEIDLALPHASAVSAAPEGAAAGREATVASEVSDDTITVSFPAASPARQAERRRFAEEVLKLNDDFPGLEADGGLTAVDCYAKGGPQWLYLGSKEGRDHILTLPFAWRQAMVEDVARDSTRAAAEIGRDILKDAEPSAGMEVTYDYLLGTVEA